MYTDTATMYLDTNGDRICIHCADNHDRADLSPEYEYTHSAIYCADCNVWIPATYPVREE